jgi:hypothetical protein
MALESCAQKVRASKSSLIVCAVREWLAMQSHPQVHFVDTTTGERRAALLAGPQVWTVAEAWLQHPVAERSAATIAESVGLMPEDVEAALAYWADNRSEIDGVLEQHRLEQDEALASWERRQMLANLNG